MTQPTLRSQSGNNASVQGLAVVALTPAADSKLPLLTCLFRAPHMHTRSAAYPLLGQSSDDLQLV